MQISKALQERIELFCKTTSLHGLKYVGQPVASKIERLFWLLSFVGAVGFACYFIAALFEKYHNNRVIVSINSKPLSTTAIPFPTVTICNMNKVNKIRAEMLLQNGSELEKTYIHDFCDFDNTSTIPQSTGKQLKKDYFINFLLQTTPSCQEMVKVCIWQLQEIDCNSVFSTILTDLGACCSFNQLPLNYIFRNPTTFSASNMERSNMVIQDWNFEKGYLPNSTNKKFPRALKGTGLTVVLDAEIRNYYCSSSNSVGFKVAATNPTETPRMKNFAINVFPGVESSISLSPVIIDATQSLRSINIRNRQCYFNSEKYLMFYRTYTIHNCIIECEANYTLQRCGCIPYFLMSINSFASNISFFKQFPSTTICEKEHELCIAEVLELVAVNEGPLEDKSQCKCLPSCFELNYSKHISYGRLSETFNISEKYIKNQSVNYFVKNMVVLNLFFLGASSSRLTKSEIFGYLELLSNMGGLLAIFLGFSFLSAAEIIYHLICKIIPIIFNIAYENFKERRKVFPFIK